ncbi:GntR family transcriptional regulator / MocR family aminotransferase [Paenibacillus algorifonticola]|uniref:GntR family transcriptional regulator / MocR family aminotransferase n=1 Tax=Paenibacillus algorifonticola TaxID=684063 RepID=A0A1I2IU49_9BACL|nr:PLP-dependent aminotransferase family protein [Paenibacillus algorifonticola]SFF45824.1 GntR family transcriptional regulator / MocR family aminotransferase [Paenibacillus algorifonticola]
MDDRCRAAYERYYKEIGRKADALFLALREVIVAGMLEDGEQLASSRRLAEGYGMSRGSVNAAYDMLYAEGFVRPGRGSGTYVSYSKPPASKAEDGPEGKGSALALSTWAQRLPQIKGYTKLPVRDGADFIAFDVGYADVDLFPLDDWKTAMFAEVRGLLERQYEDYGAIEGHLPLREAIASELRRERSMFTSVDHLFITSGSMYGIALLAQLLIDPGDQVVVENPCYPGIRRAIAAAGGVIIDAEVDDYGIIPQDWDAKLLFVTPTRQYPTGAQLAPERKLELLQWASRRGAVIIEDDYDSEFRWGGRPAEPLKTLDHEGRVVYVGTFSKTMYADLRLGYVITPDALREPLRRAKFLLEPSPSSIAEQRALAVFMASGQYVRHLRRMRRSCGRRLKLFKEQAAEQLAGLFRFTPSDAGLHQYGVWLGAAADYERLIVRCQREGVSWNRGERLWRQPDERRAPAALFGFAHLAEADIKEGMRRIAACWEDVQQQRG